MPETGSGGGSAASVGHSLREIDPDNRSDVRTITRLHLELLNWGPLASLGPLFLERCCYTVLVREHLMSALLYEVEGQSAGFIVYTCCRAGAFFHDALRRHWLRVVWLALVSAVVHPSIIRSLLAAARRLRYKRAGGIGLPSADAEILAIGVCPQYRSPAFVSRTGLHIGRHMYLHVARHLKSQGQSALQMDVDGFNRQALLFYHGLGGSFHRFEHDGETSYRIGFDLGQLQG